MTEAVNLSLERKKRDNPPSENVTPEEALRWALGDVVSGKLSPQKALIILIDGDNGRPVFTSFRADMTEAEEIGFLHAFLREQLNDWAEGK